MVALGHALTGLCLAVLLASPASAVEIAAFAGNNYGGSFEDSQTGDRYQLDQSSTQGVLLDIDDGPGKQLELFLAQQHTRVSIAALFIRSPAI